MKANIKAGQWLVISGAGGGLGHLGVQIAARGLGMKVIGIDHGSKRQLVEESGAEHFLDITQFKGDEIIQEVKKLTGRGAQAVIVCTSNNKAYKQSLHFLRFGGTMVCVGVPEGVAVPIASSKPAFMIVKQITIAAGCVGNKKDAEAVLDLAAKGIVKPHYTIKRLEDLTDVSPSEYYSTISESFVADTM